MYEEVEEEEFDGRPVRAGTPVERDENAQKSPFLILMVVTWTLLLAVPIYTKISLRDVIRGPVDRPELPQSCSALGARSKVRGPIVVSGVTGSGVGLVHGLLASLNVAMGKKCEDQACTLFGGGKKIERGLGLLISRHYHAFPYEWDAQLSDPRGSEARESREMTEEILDRLCKQILLQGRAGHWGWTDTLAIFYAPLIAAVTDRLDREHGLKFILLLRDPRDRLWLPATRGSHFSLFCTWQFQKIWQFCGGRHCQKMPAEETTTLGQSGPCTIQRFSWWAALHWALLRWASLLGQARFLVVRTEDLVEIATQDSTVRQIVKFVGMDEPSEEQLSSIRIMLNEQQQALRSPLSDANLTTIGEEIKLSAPAAHGVLCAFGYNSTGRGTAGTLPPLERWTTVGPYSGTL